MATHMIDAKARVPISQPGFVCNAISPSFMRLIGVCRSALTFTILASERWRCFKHKLLQRICLKTTERTVDYVLGLSRSHTLGRDVFLQNDVLGKIRVMAVE